MGNRTLDIWTKMCFHQKLLSERGPINIMRTIYRAVLEKLKCDVSLNKRVWSTVLNAADKYYYMGLTNFGYLLIFLFLIS